MFIASVFFLSLNCVKAETSGGLTWIQTSFEQITYFLCSSVSSKTVVIIIINCVYVCVCLSVCVYLKRPFFFSFSFFWPRRSVERPVREGGALPWIFCVGIKYSWDCQVLWYLYNLVSATQRISWNKKTKFYVERITVKFRIWIQIFWFLSSKKHSNRRSYHLKSKIIPSTSTEPTALSL